MIYFIKHLVHVVSVPTGLIHLELRRRSIIFESFPRERLFFPLLEVGSFIQLLGVQLSLFTLDYDVLALSAIPAGDDLIVLVLVEGLNWHKNLVKFVGGKCRYQGRSRLQYDG